MFLCDADTVVLFPRLRLCEDYGCDCVRGVVKTERRWTDEPSDSEGNELKKSDWLVAEYGRRRTEEGVVVGSEISPGVSRKYRTEVRGPPCALALVLVHAAFDKGREIGSGTAQKKLLQGPRRLAGILK